MAVSSTSTIHDKKDLEEDETDGYFLRKIFG